MLRPPEGSTVPLKEHLLGVYKQTGKMPKQLAEAPKLPKELTYLWDWFVSMLTTLDRLTFMEIKAWSDLTGHRLTEQEVAAIRYLDRIRIKKLGVRDVK